ncbi:hypothetical protein [Nocardiopsis sp. YSL2]|uniref:hypothetical protein n=1 Tax=Nocardiopsis sp. YSL2 TaxID=2939492 RepID=UPI0026F43756|nr:hypothetical protein [Nocardiopsis sp. YSL2]
MALYVCSLIRSTDQLIPPNQYTIVRFPFGAAESYDAWDMHQVAQPDGYSITSWDTDGRSGLIWPHVTGWGWLTAMVFWEGGSYSETRDRFVRDPLNLSTGYDSTATEDEQPTPGGQYKSKHHEMFVHPGTPVAFLVKHNDSVSRRITHAQFKLAIEADVAVPA